MKQTSTVALFQYWDRLRNGRTAPKRTEIEPADIKTMLADTFILERDLRGDAVFRLAGTRLCAAFGRELKGFAFASLFGHADQGMAAELARGGFSKKSVSVAIVQGMTKQGRSLEFELLLLPLSIPTTRRASFRPKRSWRPLPSCRPTKAFLRMRARGGAGSAISWSSRVAEAGDASCLTNRFFSCNRGLRLTDC